MEINGKTYNLLFSLNVLDEMQDRFGGYDRLDEAFNNENKDMIKDLRWLLTLVINEGLDEGEEELTEKQVGKLIHLGNLFKIKAALFEAFAFSATGGENQENDKEEQINDSEGNMEAVRE